MLRLAALSIGVALLVHAPAGAQGAKVSSPVELARMTNKLKPGQWVWAPEIAPKGPLLVYVDLSAQIATVYRNGVRVGVSSVSSGKQGHDTPTGVFSILQKDVHHRSSTYNNAPMPYQERLTWDGVALHAGGLPGYPESHGCIHLPLEFSRLLFGVTELGGTVVVAGKAGMPVPSVAAKVLAPTKSGRRQPLAPGEPYRWNPNASPSGPATIVISRSDKRLVVLRNGIEIGRSRISLPPSGFETHVLTYAPSNSGEPRWIYVGVPGHLGEKSRPADTDIIEDLGLPDPFRRVLAEAVQPGTTLLLTEAPILPSSTGQKLTVLATGPR